MKLDLAVINGLVFLDGAFQKADVGIKDEKFAMIAQPGMLPEAERTINAAGKYVIPGGIDTHVHVRDPGHSERGTFYTETQDSLLIKPGTFVPVREAEEYVPRDSL